MPEVLGNLKGIRNSIITELNKIYDFKIDNSQIINQELAITLAKITNFINREISVYIDRAGTVQSVCVGDNNTVNLPNTNNRRGEKNLCGVRCVHTHPGGNANLSGIDLSALRLNRFDAMLAIGANENEAEKSLISFAFITGLDEKNEFTLSCSESITLEEAENIFFPNLISMIEKSLSKNEGNFNINLQKEKAILVGMEYNGMENTLGWTQEDSLEELKQLADTAGAEVIKKFFQKRPKPDPAYFIGRGKVQELALFAQQENIDLCIFDEELSPAQQRNIETAMGIHVIDRTGLILDIFAQRARSNEGKLQVELAQLQYMLPRIMGKGLALSRLGGGIGTRGAGETKLELDRRHIRDRIAFIKNSIEKFKSVRDLHRINREKAAVPTISLVGYTNAGKSTLLNILTNSDIYAQDQLFATLDPTSRQLILPNKEETVLTDTVGFIQRLPHQLVAAFQSTLEDTIFADILLHVIDVSHPLYKEQSNAVYKVLDELKIKDKPIITVYNKIDKLENGEEILARLQKEENSICISAKKNINLDKLLDLITKNLALTSVEDDFYIPYAEAGMVAKLHELGSVQNEEYLDTCTKVHAIISKEYFATFEKYLKK